MPREILWAFFMNSPAVCFLGDATPIAYLPYNPARNWSFRQGTELDRWGIGSVVPIVRLLIFSMALLAAPPMSIAPWYFIAAISCSFGSDILVPFFSSKLQILTVA